MQETRICKKCGRLLPIDKMAKEKNRVRNLCKDCKNQQSRDRWRRNKIKIFEADETLKLHRHYKNVRPERILALANTDITPIAEDEVFVKLIDYRDAWISNYGRALSKYGNKYSLMHKKSTKDGEIAYQLYRNIYTNDKKYDYEKRLVEAWRLVVSEFVVNYDIANNNYCWHKSNNKEDNYYKHLYPLNEYEYAAVREEFSNTGIDSEESILVVMNNTKYRPIGWNPVRMRRTVCGVGYLGMGTKASMSNPAYRKWVNMMQRCYYEVVHKAKPYYEPCTVCEEWWNYANFEIWYNENYVENRKVDLDKDILIQGNTEYAPDTCSLVSHYTNTVFSTRRGFVHNIVKNTQRDKYDTSICLLGNKTEIGSFDTEEEAQQKLFAYKKDYISKFARKSKNKVPDKVYYAMMNWQVMKTAY